MKDKKLRERSAGFIVVRPRGSSWEVLGLRVWGKIDIPKGHVEPGESDLEAAIRECREEAGILIDPSHDMAWGPGAHTNERKHKDVVVYLATTDQEPMIMPNPETKQYEHDGYHWLTWDEMRRRCYPYLVDSVNWAQETIERGS
jgi:8-oxo-dGTP pyrophosphatase MutT (NUDIX family)